MLSPAPAAGHFEIPVKLADARPVTLQQHDVVLLRRVARFGLQGNRFADEVGKHGQPLRFFFVENVDHRHAGEDAEFTGIELPGFAQQLAQDLVRDGTRRLDLAAPAAGRALLAQDVRQ